MLPFSFRLDPNESHLSILLPYHCANHNACRLTNSFCSHVYIAIKTCRSNNLELKSNKIIPPTFSFCYVLTTDRTRNAQNDVWLLTFKCLGK